MLAVSTRGNGAPRSSRRRKFQLERSPLVGGQQLDCSAVRIANWFSLSLAWLGGLLFTLIGVDGIIRKQWNYQGVIITDDLVMGAVYGRNICTAVVEALNAGVDLLLVAFDSAQFYRIFACGSDAAAQNKLDPEMLRASQARLDRAFPRRAFPRAPSISQGADARPIGE